MWISSKMNTRSSRRRVARLSEDCILLSSDSETDLSNQTYDLTLDNDEVVDLTAVSDVSIIIMDSLDSPQVRQRSQRRRRTRNSNQQRQPTRSNGSVIDDIENTSTGESLSILNVSDQSTNIEHLSNGVNLSLPSSEQQSLSTLGPRDGSSIDNQLCPLCLDTYKEIKAKGQSLVSTTCGHVFCKKCAVQCVNSRCPTCRKKLNAKNIHPLYL